MGGLQAAHATVVGDALKAGFQNFVDQSATRLATVTTGAPAAGYFYSSIVGRAPIPDISADLRASFGVERIPVQSIVQLQNEVGASGEPVHSALNDDRGIIRFVGAWNNTNNSSGIRITQAALTAFIEITFYGTGLNILVGNVGAEVTTTYSVNGATPVALSIPSQSNVLSSRNYNPNIPFPIISGLTLGVYTVKIAEPNHNYLNVAGFEVLNAVSNSNLVNLNTGTAYIQGQKVLNSVADSVTYSTGITGAKGGRVVRYLNQDGTVGQAVTLVDTNSYTLTNANHTNEEVARTYHYREFGAGRTASVPDATGMDFSLLPDTGNNSASFTLDDGTTSLCGVSVHGYPAVAGVPVGLGANGATLVITFVGCGIDFVQQDDSAGGSDTYNIQIDGGSTQALPTAGIITKRVVKAASGLPYGTHTLRINRVAVSTWALTVHQFIVYQPKKPSIPATATEICDYNVLATYSPITTIGSCLGMVSTGVLSKTAAREITYVGTGWGTDHDPNNYRNGFSLQSQTLNDYFQYTFFGTGFDLRFLHLTNSCSSVLVSLKNLSAGGTLLPLTLTNFPGFVSSTYGTASKFTNTTGYLNQNGTNSPGSGLSVSALPLGVYQVVFKNMIGGATNYLRIEGFEIITPIHSYKSNLYADLQNTLPVGSCSLMDSRKTTPINADRPSQKAWAQAVGLSATTTSVTDPTYVPMTNMSVTIKTSGGPVKISYNTVCSGDVGGSGSTNLLFKMYVDGSAIGSLKYSASMFANGACIVSDSMIVPMSPGVHKIDVYWAKEGAITVMSANGRNLTVQEL